MTTRIQEDGTPRLLETKETVRVSEDHTPPYSTAPPDMVAMPGDLTLVASGSFYDGPGVIAAADGENWLYHRSNATGTAVYLSPVVVSDVDVTGRTHALVLGGDWNSGPAVRVNQDGTGGYRAVVGLGNNTSFNRYEVLRPDGTTLASSPKFDLTAVATTFTVRLRVSGQRIQSSAWPSNEPEPDTWDIDVEDTSTPVNSGHVALWGRSSSNRRSYLNSLNIISAGPTAVAVATPNPVMNETTPITLDGAGSTDLDGTIVSYQWEQVSGPAGHFGMATAATTTFTPAPLSGGTVTLADGYVYHTFTESGTLTVVEPVEVEYLVVAGGGGGGNASSGRGGGGGGAGGMVTGLATLTTDQTVVVGAGGVGGGGNISGGTGGDSSLGPTIALGGGGGDGGSGAGNPTPGGSGGGGANVGTLGAAGTEGQGHKGGDRGATGTAATVGAGGGGAGAAGADLADAGLEPPTAGGMGAEWPTGSGTFYAGGGGGGAAHSSFTEGAAGGLGGGGRGSDRNLFNATAGAPNTGGGGGGDSATPVGETSPEGGSGIVIVRYPLSTFPLTLPFTLA